MKKILIAFFILSSLSFAIAEEKYGMTKLEGHNIGNNLLDVSKKLEFEGKKVEIGRILSVKVPKEDLDRDYTKVIEALLESNPEVIETKNEGSNSTTIIRDQVSIQILKKSDETVSFVTIPNGLYKETLEIIDYAKINGIITDSEEEKLLKSINNTIKE